MTVPAWVTSIVVEGQTYFPGQELPDAVLERHPDLTAPDHVLNADPAKAKPKAEVPSK